MCQSMYCPGTVRVFRDRGGYFDKRVAHVFIPVLSWDGQSILGVMSWYGTTHSILRISMPFNGVTGHRMVLWCTFLWSNWPLFNDPVGYYFMLFIWVSSCCCCSTPEWLDNNGVCKVRRVILPSLDHFTDVAGLRDFPYQDVTGFSTPYKR